MLLSPMFFANRAICPAISGGFLLASVPRPVRAPRRTSSFPVHRYIPQFSIAPQSGVSDSSKTKACMRNYPQKHLELMRLNPTGMNTCAKRGRGVDRRFQTLTGVSTRAGSRKLRPRRSGPKATAMPNITMVKISNPARAQP